MSRGHVFRAVGLMSGTSADGVDAALVETDGRQGIRFLAADSLAYSASLQQQLIAAARRQDLERPDVVGLEQALTEAHVLAVQRLLEQAQRGPADVDVIGFHGHTVRHQPQQRITWQLGDAARLAQSTGLPVVSDFRQADLQAGGQGAPLAPLFHDALLCHLPRPTAVLNLGGVANITWLGPNGQILAGDTGPGCGLLDALSRRALGLPFDQDGRLAAGGGVDQAAVARTLEHPFFQAPIPKSCDRFDFDFVDVSHLNPADGAATLCAITAEAVRVTVDRLPALPNSVWLCGGGAHHPVLRQKLADRLPACGLIDQLGFRGDSLEAECFAWLAVRHLLQLPASLPSTTGCREPTAGGVLTRPAE